MFLDFTARLFLLGSSELALLIIIGYLVINRSIFARTLMILTFSMILNAYLKSVFQVPLPSSANPTQWRLPSGHMQSATVFWCWLAWEFKNKRFTVFTLALLPGIAWGLIHFNYHTVIDLQTAVVTGLALLFGFFLILKTRFIQEYPHFLGFLLIVLALPLIVLFPSALFHQYRHIWVAFGALVGFSIGWMLEKRAVGINSWKNKIFALLLAAGGMILIKIAFGHILSLTDYSSFLVFLEYFLISIWVSKGVNSLARIFSRDEALPITIK